jgi:transcriptional regulator with XRE-family HTH domain
MSIAQRLKECRHDADMTQESLAFASGVSVAHVTKIETGSRTPSDEIVRKLAGALEVDASELRPDIDTDAH